MPLPLLRLPALATLLLLGLPGRHPWLAQAQTLAPPAQRAVSTYVEPMPQLPGGGGTAAIGAAVPQRVVLPAGTAASSNRGFVRLTVGKQRQVEEVTRVKGAGPAVDAAVLAAGPRLPTFVPGQQNGRLARASLTLPIVPPSLVVPTVPDSPKRPQESDDDVETRTLLTGQAERLAGEADSTFVRRVLPLAFAASPDLLAAAWRPGGYGKQLFFSMPSRSDTNEQGSDLVVLDPFYKDTYALHIFTIPALTGFVIPSQGKATVLTAIFFADVNQDGQKELLVLSQGSQLEPEGFKTHCQTQVFQYLDLTSTGRPQYYEDAAQRENFWELATVAEVRQALARRQPRRLPAPAAPGKPTKKQPR